MKRTPNYNLMKPDQTDFYDVDNFNINADIIDAKLKDLEDNKANSNSMTELQKQVTTHLDEYNQHIGNQQIHVTQAKQDRWNSGLLVKTNIYLTEGTDFNNIEPNKVYQVGSTVNSPNAPPASWGVLIDLFPFVHYRVQEFTSVIGNRKFVRTRQEDTWHPWIKILNQDDYDALFTLFGDKNTKLALAISEKGVPTDASATGDQMAANIRAIQTGKKSARGSTLGIRQSDKNDLIQISGLDFLPKIILVRPQSLVTGTILSAYIAKDEFTIADSDISFYVAAVSAGVYQPMPGEVSVQQGGFSIKVGNPLKGLSSENNPQYYSWLALS